jgi:copper chaperone NosL
LGRAMTFLQRSNWFLELRLGMRERVLIVLAALVLIAVFAAPLWNLTMFAPQYPDGLRLNIYAFGLEAGRNGQDLKEINLLNHYIGMQDLVNSNFREFQWMPFVIGGLALVFLRAAAFGEMKHLVDSLMLYVYFALFSLWSFAHTLYAYGHELSPTAAVKVPPFMPPVFGSKQLANFEVYSYPAAATYALMASGLLLFAAVYFAWRTSLVSQGASDAARRPAGRAAVHTVQR